MTITDVSANVQTLLENMPEIKQVIPAPPDEESNFSSFPAACHYYSGTQGDYATVTQNRRVINHTVELYLITPEGTSTVIEHAKMYALVDAVIDMFDRSIDLSGDNLGIADLPRACDIMRPAPGELVPIPTDKGTGLMCAIQLYCAADVDFR